ncbi:hypothetical protein LXL04_004899 [Taraxacum kok-saghyz]
MHIWNSVAVWGCSATPGPSFWQSWDLFCKDFYAESFRIWQLFKAWFLGWYRGLFWDAPDVWNAIKDRSMVDSLLHAMKWSTRGARAVLVFQGLEMHGKYAADAFQKMGQLHLVSAGKGEETLGAAGGSASPKLPRAVSVFWPLSFDLTAITEIVCKKIIT